VDQATLQRVGSALRRMGEDLVAERRRVILLTRENEDLRAQLAELRRAATNEAPAAATLNAAGSGRRP
jgi:cell division septum initiation protein DivIVA